MSDYLLTARWALCGPDLTEMPDHAVLVRNDRIVWTGPVTEAPVTDQRSDLGDATLMPGLIDAHMHSFGMDSLQLGNLELEREAYRALRAAGELHELLRAGFTSARCLGSSIGPDLARAIRDGHVPGPRLVAAGAFISSTGGTWDTGPLPDSFASRALSIADGPDALRQIVRARARQGADFIKLGLSKGRPGDRNHAWGDDPHHQVPALTLDETRAATDEAHRMGLTVSAHAIGEASVVLALDGGVDVIEHGYAITNATRQRLVATQTPVVTTLAQVQYHRLAYDAFHYPEVDRRIYDRHWAAMTRDFTTGVQAGVRFVLGTDMIGKPTHPLADAAAEFALAVGLGMTPHQALCAGTVRAAEVLGLGDQTGQMSPGYLADLVAFKGRVSTDMGLLATPPRMVMAKGRRVA
jgi:imidazolonepropionase-like amidohydrolase